MEKGRSERENKAVHQSHPAELGIAGEYVSAESAKFTKWTG